MTDHDADVLAKAEAWLDTLDPDTTPAQDPKELRRIGLAKGDFHASETELRNAVHAAREAGYTWAAIGMTLGVTRQAAQARFRNRARS